MRATQFLVLSSNEGRIANPGSKSQWQAHVNPFTQTSEYDVEFNNTMTLVKERGFIMSRAQTGN